MAFEKWKSDIMSLNHIECVAYGSEYQYTKSSTIITELLEIIQSQSEALKRISQTKGLQYTVIELWPKDELIKTIQYDTQVSLDVLSETNTRLQNLRDVK